MIKCGKTWSKEEWERYQKSRERFDEAMANHEPDRKGQVIAINFNSGEVIKSKCKKGRKVKAA